MVGGALYYDEEGLTVAKLVADFARYGIEPRHLRLFRNAVDREIGLIEQVVTPLLRQRNPEARQRAVDAADELSRLGQVVAGRHLRRALRHHFGGWHAAPTWAQAGLRADDGRREASRRYIASMVEVRLRAVRVDLQSNTPVLLLQETDGEGRTLPIFIGTPEAAAIAYALQGVTMPRPMTHDLIKDMLVSLNVEIERVVITELQNVDLLSLSCGSSRLRRDRGARAAPRDRGGRRRAAPAVRSTSSDELMDAEGILLADEGAEEEESTNRRPTC